jgi:hypothetical protein
MIVTIKDLGRDCPLTEIKGHGWFPARPINYQCRTLRVRFREAWMVFAGKADPFVWPEDSLDNAIGEARADNAAPPHQKGN